MPDRYRVRVTPTAGRPGFLQLRRGTQEKHLPQSGLVLIRPDLFTPWQGSRADAESYVREIETRSGSTARADVIQWGKESSHA